MSTVTVEVNPENFGFSGGSLGLDFVNTVDWRTSDQPEELLPTYAHLVAWGQAAGLLDPDAASQLATAGERRPREAAEVLERGRRLRDAIYGLVERLRQGLPAEAADLAILNAELGVAVGHLRLASEVDGRLGWRWIAAGEDLDRVLWPVARAAAESIGAGDYQRIRQCEGEGCGWLFVDTSRNHQRRWCSMQSCGNRAKARRFYARQKEAITH